MIKLHISEIRNLKILNPHTRKVIDIFLSAINDWPNSILTFEDYESEVEKFINGVTTKNNLQNILNKIDFSINAWQAESLSQVIEVFQYYNENMSLKSIIEDLKMKLSIS